MTQPAVDGPVHPAGEPAQPVEPAYPGQQPGPGGTPWRKAAVIAAAGVPVGLLWWLLAPSGLNLLTGDPDLAAGTNTATWLPRDLVLAGLCLLAGCIAGSFVAGTKHHQPGTGTVILVVLAGVAGALIAWGTGVLSAQWWGAPAGYLGQRQRGLLTSLLCGPGHLARGDRPGHLPEQPLPGLRRQTPPLTPVPVTVRAPASQRRPAAAGHVK